MVMTDTIVTQIDNATRRGTELIDNNIYLIPDKVDTFRDVLKRIDEKTIKVRELQAKGGPSNTMSAARMATETLLESRRAVQEIKKTASQRRGKAVDPEKERAWRVKHNAGVTSHRALLDSDSSDTPTQPTARRPRHEPQLERIAQSDNDHEGMDDDHSDDSITLRGQASDDENSKARRFVVANRASSTTLSTVDTVRANPQFDPNRMVRARTTRPSAREADAEQARPRSSSHPTVVRLPSVDLQPLRPVRQRTDPPPGRNGKSATETQTSKERESREDRTSLSRRRSESSSRTNVPDAAESNTERPTADNPRSQVHRSRTYHAGGNDDRPRPTTPPRANSSGAVTDAHRKQSVTSSSRKGKERQEPALQSLERASTSAHASTFKRPPLMSSGLTAPAGETVDARGHSSREARRNVPRHKEALPGAGVLKRPVNTSWWQRIRNRSTSRDREARRLQISSPPSTTSTSNSGYSDTTDTLLSHSSSDPSPNTSPGAHGYFNTPVVNDGPSIPIQARRSPHHEYTDSGGPNVGLPGPMPREGVDRLLEQARQDTGPQPSPNNSGVIVSHRYVRSRKTRSADPEQEDRPNFDFLDDLDRTNIDAGYDCLTGTSAALLQVEHLLSAQATPVMSPAASSFASPFASPFPPMTPGGPFTPMPMQTPMSMQTPMGTPYWPGPPGSEPFVFHANVL